MNKTLTASISPRKQVAKFQQSSQKQKQFQLRSNLQNKFNIFPNKLKKPIVSFLFRLIRMICLFKWLLFGNKKEKDKNKQQLFEQFHVRQFEEPLEWIDLKPQDLGFTNQVLIMNGKKQIQLFLPVYITCKIKSIQQISVQEMTGNVNTAMIINVHYGDLPQQLVKYLQSSILVQLNRGQSMKLSDDETVITVKRNKKVKFIIFTIRRVFLANLQQETLWSPFQLIQLIVSLTLNTVTINPNTIQKVNQQSQFDPNKSYKISFNCMRNSDQVPMSYALDCVFGVYDLAQKKMSVYHTNLNTYGQVIKVYKQKCLKKLSSDKQQKKLQKLDQQSRKKVKQRSKQVQDLISTVLTTTVQRLKMRKSNIPKKQQAPKVKYFQYTHFIVTLYKYPGNALASIFIPLFLLALISLAIFFQEPELSGRIGAIATMVLGYIQLIPSIKQQLPPSSKMTIIQTVVYIETMCCLLCLYQSFSIAETQIFVWYQSITFLICSAAHIFCFLFITALYMMHKFIWEPSYNIDTKQIQIKPADNIQGWDNPYCDFTFKKYNQKVKKMKDSQQKFYLIQPYTSIKNNKSNISHKSKQSQCTPINFLSSILSPKKVDKKQGSLEKNKQKIN